MRNVVLFATPTRERSVSVDYHMAMLHTLHECNRHQIVWDSKILTGSPFLDKARNELVHHFLTSEWNFTDLVFIDDDEGWDAKVIPRILNHPQGVVCALPPKKCDPPTYHSNALTGTIENGLFQSLEGGTGFMRIKREVFERMDAAYPELKELTEQDVPWPHTPYFQDGNTKYGCIGEDIFFCRQLLAMGEHVWIDSDVTFTHRGSRAWKGNFYDHAVSTGLLKSA